MRRIPIYVFENLNSPGIYNVPLESTIQINDSDGNGTPLTIQLTSKEGLNPGSTIADLLTNEDNYVNQTEDTEIPSELEKIEQNGKTGWRILGRDPINYASIGQDAIDMSQALYSGSGSSPYGASGNNSFAIGVNTEASGDISFAGGWGTKAINRASTALGQYNVGISTNNIFEIGIGSEAAQRKNGFSVNKSGEVVADELTIGKIEASTENRLLVTKEYVTQEFDKKFDKTGGIISGSVDITGNLGVNGNASVDGVLSVETIDTSINLQNELIVGGQSRFNNDLFLSKSIFIGNTDTKSIVYFKDIDNANSYPAIYWEGQSGQKEFKVDTLTSIGNTLWHSGNFTPDDKFDKTGGLISGDLEVMGNTTINGDLSIQNIITDVNFENSITVGNALTVENDITTNSSLYIGNTQNNSVINFKDAQDANLIPALYWKTADKEFQVKTDTGIDYTIWHAGNFTPSSKINVSEKAQPNGVATLDENGIILETQLPHESVTSVNGYSYLNGHSDVVLTTDDINEGNNNLYYTENRVNDVITSRINDSASLGSTTVLWSADKIQTELNTKLDAAGGVISSDLNIEGDLTVDGSTILNGVVDLSNNGSITGDVTFSNDIVFNQNIFVRDSVQIDGKLVVGIDANNNDSRIEFIDAEDMNTSFVPAFYWENATDEFKVDTNTTTGATVWHSGNFIPGSKLDVNGGTITGSLTVQQDLRVDHNFILNGIFTEEAEFDKNVAINLDLYAGGQITAGGGIRTGISSNGVDSVIAFTDNNDPNALPAIYWNGTDKDFNIDTLNQVGLKIYHEGNLTSIVNRVNGKNGDVVLTTSDINEGVNLYYTNARVDARIAEARLDDLFDVDVTAVQNGQTIKWDDTAGKWVPSDDNAPVTTVNGYSGDVVLTTDDIAEGNNNKYLTLENFDNIFVNNYLQDTATSGDTDKVWSADKIYSELQLKLDKTGGTISNNLLVQGSFEVDTGATLRGTTYIERVGNNQIFDQDLYVQGRIGGGEDLRIGKDLTVGISDPNYSRIVFNDATDGEKPSIVWDSNGGPQGTGDFYITTGTSGLLELWSRNNFIPETTLDTAGGTITGYLTINNDLQVQNKSTLNDIEVNGQATFANAVDIPGVLDDCYFSKGIVVNDAITAHGETSVGDDLYVGIDNPGTGVDSKIWFIDSDDPNQVNRIRWDQADKVFYVDAGGNQDLMLWHAGTFNPDTKINVSEKAQAGGVATLGPDGKIPTNQLPPLAITDVYVVATIADRDNLTDVERGDVCKVTDADGNGHPQTYIYNGSDWIDIQETSDVISVNGQTGVVTLTTTEIAEGTNLYWTQSRFDTAFTNKTTSDLAEGSNLYWTVARGEAMFDNKMAAATTDDLSEGSTNLYYTDARADARIAAASIDDLSDVDTSTTAPANGQVLKWDGTNWVPADDEAPVTSVNGKTGAVSLTTDDISEGSTNLYYTDARADARVTAAIDDNAGTGITDKLWSADKITTELSAKFNKNGDTLTGNMKLNGGDIISYNDLNTLKVIDTGTGNSNAYFDNKNYITIGDTDQLVSLIGTVFEPLVLKNDSSVQAWDSGYTEKKNLVSRWDNDSIVLGDEGAVVALRADTANGFEPQIRDGVYGSTTDYTIWHEGNRKVSKVNKIADPTTATAEDVANKINELIDALTTAGIMTA